MDSASLPHDVWPAPAKLNLCLHIVGRRPDGYHLLQTAFQFIDLCDELAFVDRPAGIVERISGLEEVPAEQDLVVRAARLLLAQTDVSKGVGIVVRKRIPVQGGLGGGSSDAATVLVALNHLWGLGLSLDELAGMGAGLGADVPVFVHGRAAWAEGIGDILTPYDFPAPVYLVVQPGTAVSTAEIFQAPELTRNSPLTTIRAFLATGGRNDCTSTVRQRYREVSEALDWLQHFTESRLTGTGACVYGTFAEEGAARRVLEQLPARWRGYVARGLNRSPLHARLSER